MALPASLLRRALAFLVLLSPIVLGGGTSLRDSFTNSIGMTFVRIEPGTFRMGEEQAIPEGIREEGMGYLHHGDWDEHPVHEVTISQPFYLAVTEVTVEQYLQFDPDFQGSEVHAPYVSGISWNEAQAFCDWLSEREGKPYRLPTEAEWEYAARAETTTLFSSGDAPPSPETANAWGVENMHTGVAEWVSDWHGEYLHGAQTDPVGPERGIAKAVRGGGLDRPTPYYARSANRAGIAPNFPPAGARERQAELLASAEPNAAEANAENTTAEERRRTPEGFEQRVAYERFVRDVLNNQGNHNVGLRVVQAPEPTTTPWPVEAPFFQQGVKVGREISTLGPDPSRPYFRKRPLLPIPPENTPVEQLDALAATGLHPAILRHHHSPALEVAPNGDVIAVYYTSVDEVTPDVAMIATRLRFGADDWDLPSFFLDFPDVDDHAPLLWQDADTLRFFWGANKLDSGFPFQWITSTDNGATWSAVHFSVFETPVGPHSAQPINSAFRSQDGTMYVASDAVGPESVLWVSHNDGRTWVDTGGRTGGRHTSFALLADGRLLGMGGKSSNIDGFMPRSISNDGGATWEISQTPFPWLGSNQRPTVVRLRSGRLFFAGDLQNRDGSQPEGFTQRGAYVALSDDEGETWHLKRLPGAEEHELASRREEMRGATLGYAVARQAPNGLIHLITSMNEQALHFALNEAWILSPDEADPDALPTEPVATRIADVQDYEERYPDGTLRAAWSGGVAGNGRYLLHGLQTTYYPSGQTQWKATYDLGRKTGEETFRHEDGRRAWSWSHRPDGTHVWATYWPNGQKRTESTWDDGLKAQGTATRWSPEGAVVQRVTFRDGLPTD